MEKEWGIRKKRILGTMFKIISAVSENGLSWKRK